MRYLRLAGLFVLVACNSEVPADAGPDAQSVDTPPPPYDGHREYPRFCDGPTPGPEALRRMNDPVLSLLPSSRALTPVGTQVELGGFPILTRLHPTLPLAYVANVGYGRRAIQVVDLVAGAVVQEIERPELFHGLALSADATHLYVSTGEAATVEEYLVAADGMLTAGRQLAIDSYPAGLALSRDGTRLWVGRFLPATGEMAGIVEIDPATFTERRRLELPAHPYQLLELPTRNELWYTVISDAHVHVIDLSTFTEAASLTVGSNPVSLVASADEHRLYVTVADADIVVAIDPATRTVVGDVSIAAADGVNDADGTPLHASSPSGLALDEATNRLYVTRAADDAVEVLDATTLTSVGTIPVGWYPSAVGVGDGRLVVLNAKGVGTGPITESDGGKAAMTGTVSIIDVASLDLSATTTDYRTNIRRPTEVLPFDCADAFPVPSAPGRVTPIEHIILVVRENKTYDSLLGDLETGEADPSLVLFGEDVTPNLHALARTFVNHDNFYDDGETSVQGHFWLTSSFVNDYMERTWLEDYRNSPGFTTDPVDDRGAPDVGTFFTHLMRHDIDFRIFGEIVGSTGMVGTANVSSHIDRRYPGVFFNLDVPDQERAEYLAQRIDRFGLPPFSYVLFPRDHTYGLSGGRPTPESMVSDNDYATGLLVEAVSHSDYWEHTAIFIVEDDTQIGGDHIDYHRSILVIASPWARHGATSSVHTSYGSLFRTFELILGIPPMHREDALATPLFDAFTGTPDLTPYDARARRIPDGDNPSSGFFADVSRSMRFEAPDQNPGLGETLWRARRGEMPSDAHWAPTPGFDFDGATDEAAREDLDEAIDESVIESATYLRELEAFRAWAATHPMEEE